MKELRSDPSGPSDLSCIQAKGSWSKKGVWHERENRGRKRGREKLEQEQYRERERAKRVKRSSL